MKLVYITCPHIEEARTLGRALVEKKLAACINILNGMESIYSWDGKIEEAGEVVLLAKTSEEKVDALIEATEELHSYDVPCAMALPIDEISAGYQKWLEGSL